MVCTNHTPPPSRPLTRTHTDGKEKRRRSSATLALGPDACSQQQAISKPSHTSTSIITHIFASSPTCCFSFAPRTDRRVPGPGETLGKLMILLCCLSTPAILAHFTRRFQWPACTSLASSWRFCDFVCLDITSLPYLIRQQQTSAILARC